ncbi:MAG: PadR family transcriptional regulator [Candidatus Hodarchaeota archaeon]
MSSESSTSEESETKAFKRLRKMLTKENLWLYILRLLQERPRYGYEIKNEIRKRFGFSPAIVTGYVILYKMKRDGLVEVSLEKNETKRQDRKYYRITQRGQESMKMAKGLLLDLMKKVFD